MGRRELSPPPPTSPNEFCCVKPRANGRNIVCQQLPTMLRPLARSLKFDQFQTLRKTFQQHATTCNRVYQRTQHVTSNNVGSCWQTTLGPFASSITLIFKSEDTTKKYCYSGPTNKMIKLTVQSFEFSPLNSHFIFISS